MFSRNHIIWQENEHFTTKVAPKDTLDIEVGGRMSLNSSSLNRLNAHANLFSSIDDFRAVLDKLQTSVGGYNDTFGVGKSVNKKNYCQSKYRRQFNAITVTVSLITNFAHCQGYRESRLMNVEVLAAFDMLTLF